MSKPFLQKLSSEQTNNSWASQQALAILAVDGIRPTKACIALMQSVENGSLSHAQAIQSVIDRARTYAKH